MMSPRLKYDIMKTPSVYHPDANKQENMGKDGLSYNSGFV